jgi:D-glycero-D-manno-heptose 1,7-bisphosphate phosphatase
MKKAVFLDRDGVLNKERGEYTYKTVDFEWVPDAIKALKLLNENGFELIIISNQGGVSKNLYTKTDIFNIENAIKQPLEKYGINILDTFYCPHHDAIEKCLCRKPKSLMLEKAIAKHNIDPEQSYFIGDSDRDMIAGQQVGVKGILMQPNVSLLLAVKDILDESR